MQEQRWNRIKDTYAYKVYQRLQSTYGRCKIMSAHLYQALGTSYENVALESLARKGCI